MTSAHVQPTTPATAPSTEPLDYDRLLARLCFLAAEEVSMDPAAVHPDSDLVADLNFDSLDRVNYAMNIEDEFDVAIPDDQAEEVRTPRQATDALVKALQEQSSIPAAQAPR